MIGTSVKPHQICTQFHKFNHIKYPLFNRQPIVNWAVLASLNIHELCTVTRCVIRRPHIMCWSREGETGISHFIRDSSFSCKIEGVFRPGRRYDIDFESLVLREHLRLIPAWLDLKQTCLSRDQTETLWMFSPYSQQNSVDAHWQLFKTRSNKFWPTAIYLRPSE